MTGAFARQHRPRPTPAAAVPGRAVLVLPVLVAGVAAPAWTGRQAHLQRRVHPLQAAEDSLVLRPAQPVADQLQELRRDRAVGWAPVGVGAEPDVLPRRQRAPGLDAVVPVVGHGSKVARRDVLAGVA